MSVLAEPPATFAALEPTLSGADFAQFAWLSRRLPVAWTSTRRRRRFLFLAMAAPGFVAVFSTPLHRSLALLALGSLLFAAALAVRRRTEPVFVRAEAAALWPPPPPPLAFKEV